MHGHEISFNLLERRVKQDFKLNNIKVIDGGIPNILKIFDFITYFHTKKSLKFDLGMLNSLFNDKLHLNLYLDLDKALLSTIPSGTDINVATLAQTAYPVYLSEAKVKIYHMQHFEPILNSNKLEKVKALKSYTLPLLKIANSTWLQNKLKKELDVDSKFIPWAIDHTIFNTKPIVTDSLPCKFNRENNQKYILSLGKSTEFKGLKDLFAALKYVKFKRPDLNFTLILYGNEPFLQGESPVNTIYIYRPSDKELVYLYQNADVVITPSWYESFPLPPLEAMACGTPVITTMYGVEDYAINNYNSIVIPPRDIKKMASSIIEVLENESLKERLKKNGPLTAKKFTWNKCVNKVEDFYWKSLRSI
jgi:glycosyltransferase involved in cell wall biosynthesis